MATPYRVQLILALAAATLCSAAKADIETARARLDDSRRARQAANNAAAQGDGQKADELAGEAESALEAALELFAEARAENSNDVDVLRDYSEALQFAGDHDLSAEALERAVKLRENDADLWLALGQSYIRWGPARAADAERCLKRATRETPAAETAGRAFTALGRFYFEQGLYEMAGDAYRSAFEKTPEDVSAIVGLAALKIRGGALLEGMNDIDALGARLNEGGPGVMDPIVVAAHDFTRFRLWFPDTAENHMAYGKLMLQANRLPESLGPFERATQLDQTNFVAFNLLGSVNRTLGRFMQARAAFQRSIEINPDQPRTREVLGEIDRQISAQPPADSPRSITEPAPGPPALAPQGG